MNVPTVVLVHGAFADSRSWEGVLERLLDQGVAVNAVANPLRGVAIDAAYVGDVIDAIGGPVLLVGHAYGGMVITQAAADRPDVLGLVYVSAFAPEHDESVFGLSRTFFGSTLDEALAAYPLSTGGTELVIRPDVFRQQFAADVSAEAAAVMAAAQRPVTEAALVENLSTEKPAWKTLPSWFAFGDLDRTIPVSLHRFMAVRAGALGTTEVPGGSHALSVSHPYQVVATIFDALDHLTRKDES